MTSKQDTECYVYITLPGETEAVTARRFELTKDRRRNALGRFVFGKSYLARGNVFGPRIERALDQRGVRVAGIHYQSPRLQEYRRKVGDTKVSVKFDPENLGKISVWIDEGWLSVPALGGSFAGENGLVSIERYSRLREYFFVYRIV